MREDEEARAATKAAAERMVDSGGASGSQDGQKKMNVDENRPEVRTSKKRSKDEETEERGARSAKAKVAVKVPKALRLKNRAWSLLL